MDRRRRYVHALGSYGLDVINSNEAQNLVRTPGSRSTFPPSGFLGSLLNIKFQSSSSGLQSSTSWPCLALCSSIATAHNSPSTTLSAHAGSNAVRSVFGGCMSRTHHFQGLPRILAFAASALAVFDPTRRGSRLRHGQENP